MQMMYDVIARGLKNSKLENTHPQDYLNFYCLGNREQCDEKVSNSSSQSSSNGGSVNDVAFDVNLDIITIFRIYFILKLIFLFANAGFGFSKAR